MAITRFDPFRDVFKPMMDIRTDLDRLFGDFFGRRGVAPVEAPEYAVVPAIEVSETDNDIMVKAALPGVDKNDVKVEIVGDKLNIHAEVKKEKKEEKENLLAQELYYGSFTRVVALPCEVQADKAKGELKNGIMIIRIPKSEQVKAKAVSIELK